MNRLADMASIAIVTNVEKDMETFCESERFWLNDVNAFLRLSPAVERHVLGSKLTLAYLKFIKTIEAA